MHDQKCFKFDLIAVGHRHQN